MPLISSSSSFSLTELMPPRAISALARDSSRDDRLTMLLEERHRAIPFAAVRSVRPHFRVVTDDRSLVIQARTLTDQLSDRSGIEIALGRQGGQLIRRRPRAEAHSKDSSPSSTLQR